MNKILIKRLHHILLLSLHFCVKYDIFNMLFEICHVVVQINSFSLGHSVMLTVPFYYSLLLWKEEEQACGSTSRWTLKPRGRSEETRQEEEEEEAALRPQKEALICFSRQHSSRFPSGNNRREKTQQSHSLRPLVNDFCLDFSQYCYFNVVQINYCKRFDDLYSVL